METGENRWVFSRPGNGYDVLGLQSDTVEVLETNSSALRSFQVPNFFGYQKKLEGLVVGCWLFFSCLGAITRGSDFWLLVFVVCLLFFIVCWYFVVVFWFEDPIIPQGEYFFNEVATLTPIVFAVSRTSLEIEKMFLRRHVDQIDEKNCTQTMDFELRQQK